MKKIEMSYMRVVLLSLWLVMGVGSAWGQETTDDFVKNKYKAIVAYRQAANCYYAMDTIVSNYKFGTQSVVVLNEKVFCEDDIAKRIAWTCENNTLATFGKGYLKYTSETNITLNYKTSYSWSINEQQQIYDKTSIRFIAYNYNSGNPRFGAYVSSNSYPKATLMDFATDEDGYMRTGLSAGKVGTICLARSVSAGNVVGAKIYTIVGKILDSDGNPTDIVLEEITNGLIAGRPYIFIADSETLVAAYDTDSEAVTEASDYNGLYGVIGDTHTVTDSEQNIYAITNNTVKAAATGTTIRDCRAYIDMSKVPVYGASSAKSVITFSIGNAYTGVTPVSNDMITDDAMYNLNGQRIVTPVKGQIYIKGGKKYVER